MSNGSWRRGSWAGVGAAPRRLHPIPECLQGVDGIRKSGDGPRTVPGAGQLRPHGSLSQDGPQGPGRSQTRSCVHRSAAATRAGLGELPSGSPASEAQSLAQTLPKPHRAPQNKPPVLAQHLSQRAKRTQQTPETPSHRCHLASSLQPNPLPNSGAVERRSCDTTVL